MIVSVLVTIVNDSVLILLIVILIVKVIPKIENVITVLICARCNQYLAILLQLGLFFEFSSFFFVEIVIFVGFNIRLTFEKTKYTQICD